MSDAAIATIVTGVVTIATLICGVVTLWLKLKQNNKKIDDNTVVTKAGTAAAEINAKLAAMAANDSIEYIRELAQQLNGKLEDRIKTIVQLHTEPILVTLREHAAQDDKNMTEIRQALGELRDRTAA